MNQYESVMMVIAVWNGRHTLAVMPIKKQHENRPDYTALRWIAGCAQGEPGGGGGGLGVP